jgi:PAS domain S-box-containing protein
MSRRRKKDQRAAETRAPSVPVVSDTTSLLQARLVAISRAVRDAIVMIDNDGGVSHWNEAAETIFGYSRQEALGKNLHQLLAPQRYHAAHRTAFESFRLGGEGDAIGKTLELVGRRKSGQEFPLELSLAPMHFEGKWCAVGLVRDITERKRIEERLQRSEARYRETFEGASVGQAIVGLDGRFQEVNATLARLLGYSTTELVGRSFQDVTHPDDRAASLEARNACRSGEKSDARLEKRYLRKDGKVVWVDVNVARLCDASGAATGFITQIIDVDARKAAELRAGEESLARQQMELELQHAQKLEAVGRLASGIAHEINTPAQFVGDNLNFLKEACAGYEAVLACYQRLSRSDPERGWPAEALAGARATEESVDLPFLHGNAALSLDRALEGVSRISGIVRAMKEFAHPDEREKKPADLNEAIKATLIIAHNEYKYVAEVEPHFEELPMVNCHVGDLNQVFLNLLVNASHAIGEVVGRSGARGKIRVSTRPEGPAVCIQFSDTGAGIPESIRARIFEPFFTTKPTGTGTGQGLAIARSIVADRHGGSLSFESRVGEGTTFTIRLPVDGGSGQRGQHEAEDPVR